MPRLWILCLLLGLLIVPCRATQGSCDGFTSPALDFDSLRSPWSIASGPNEWLPSITYDPALADIQDGELQLTCLLDIGPNSTVTPDNSTYLAGAVKTDSPLDYGFLDFSLQPSSSFWETVVQSYQLHADTSYDYIVVGLAPTYIYMSAGINFGSSSPMVLDISVSLQNIFGTQFDASFAFHNYSLLRTSGNCVVYLDGILVGGFSRSDLNGLWPFLSSDGEIPFYVMQSNLNSRAGDNATTLISYLNATSLRCYEVDVGRVNDLNVNFPSGTADFVLENTETTTSSDTIALVLSTVQTFDSSKSATSSKVTLPVNPRMWNRTTSCDRKRNTCTYIFDVLLGNLTLTATYTFFREDTVVVLGSQETKVRGGDFRLDLVATPLAGVSLYRVELLLESNAALAGNLSTLNASQLNLQSGPIAMNISFMDWNPQANLTSMAHIAYSKTSNFSALMTIEFQMSLIGFFRIANFDGSRSRFRWWMAVVGVAGLLAIFVAIILFVKLAMPRLRRYMRRRRRRAIEMRAARVVTA